MPSLLPVLLAVGFADWYVDDDNCPGGSGSPADPFCKIADAIAAAADGDRVLIAAGTYVENLLCDKDLSFHGESAESVVVDGGSVWRALQVTVDASVVAEDITFQHGCSGIANFGELSLTRCTVRRNQADIGAGIFNQGKMTVTDCAVVDNCTCGTIVGWGGGVFNAGEFTAHRSLFARNEARGGAQPGGGGLYHESGLLALENCTISGNSTIHAGGVYVLSGYAALIHCTVTENEVTTAAGGIENEFGRLYLEGTIVAGNHAGSSPDGLGRVDSIGYNIIGDSTGIHFHGDQSGDQIDVDPLLLPLEDNGGFTASHSFAAGSPARDRANPDPNQCPAEDQRGESRPRDSDCDGTSHCDVGAVEESGEASWRNYGTGWAGTLGVPGLTTDADPVLSTRVHLLLDNSAGSDTTAWLLAGETDDEQATPWGGTIWVTPQWIRRVPLPASGLSIALDVPADPTLCGYRLHVQALELDGGASDGLSFTMGLRLIFGE